MVMGGACVEQETVRWPQIPVFSLDTSFQVTLLPTPHKLPDAHAPCANKCQVFFKLNWHIYCSSHASLFNVCETVLLFLLGFYLFIKAYHWGNFWVSLPHISITPVVFIVRFSIAIYKMHISRYSRTDYIFKSRVKWSSCPFVFFFLLLFFLN